MSLGSNVVQLPALTTGNGNGTVVATSQFGDKRTIVLNGAFNAVFTVQASHDGVNFVDVHSFFAPGNVELNIAAPFMRLRTSAFIAITTVLCYVGGDPAAVQTQSLALPAGNVNGTGAVSSVLPLGGKKTVFVTGSLPQCAVIIEASATVGTSGSNTWQQIAAFYGPGFQNVEFEGASMRVRVSGLPSGLTYTGTVGVCASDEAITTDTAVNELTGTTSITVFVSAEFGDDANSGLDVTTPLQTIKAVYEKFPQVLLQTAQIIVNLAAGGVLGDTQAIYPVNTMLVSGGDASMNRYCYRGPAMVRVLTIGVNVVVGGLTAVVVGNRTRIDVAPSPGWTANALRGFYVRITSAGLKTISEQVITENDADSIFVDTQQIQPFVAAGNTLEIVRPGARLNAVAPAAELLIKGQAGALPSTRFWGGPPITSPQATFERLEVGAFAFVTGVYAMTLDRCRMLNMPAYKGGSVAHFNCSYPNGVKIQGGSLELPMDPRPDSATDPPAATVNIGTELQSFGIFLVGQPDGPGNYFAWRNVSVYGQANAARGAIHVYGMGSFFYAAPTVGFAGILQVALQGSGNAGPFIWCLYGGQARINTTIGATPQTTGTGTGNPLRVGVGAANPAIAYGSAAGQYEEAVGFNANFHRMLAGTAAAPTGDASRIYTALS